MTVRRQIHGLPLVAGFCAGVAAWFLLLRGQPADPRLVALLGVAFATPLPALFVASLGSWLASGHEGRRRAGVAGAVGLALAVAMPLARGSISNPAICLVVLGVVAIQLLLPLPGVVTVGAAAAIAGLLR